MKEREIESTPFVTAVQMYHYQVHLSFANSPNCFFLILDNFTYV